MANNKWLRPIINIGGSLSGKVGKMSMCPEDQKGHLGFILLIIKRFFLTLSGIQDNVAWKNA
jgi:hypothetical protein